MGDWLSVFDGTHKNPDRTCFLIFKRKYDRDCPFQTCLDSSEGYLLDLVLVFTAPIVVADGAGYTFQKQ
jgi:hypothetical protein